MMKNDQIERAAREDPLIICIGNDYMRRNVCNRLMRTYASLYLSHICYGGRTVLHFYGQ